MRYFILGALATLLLPPLAQGQVIQPKVEPVPLPKAAPVPIPSCQNCQRALAPIVQYAAPAPTVTYYQPPPRAVQTIVQPPPQIVQDAPYLVQPPPRLVQSPPQVQTTYVQDAPMAVYSAPTYASGLAVTYLQTYAVPTYGVTAFGTAPLIGGGFYRERHVYRSGVGIGGFVGFRGGRFGLGIGW